jgi:transcriptional regulator of acetoin/glycerol metabolism
LAAYAWPGNVRELEHQMQRLAAVGVTRIELEHLPREIRAAAANAEVQDAVRSRSGSEHDEVAEALAACGGNITHAAARLGLTRHGLKKRMLRLGMRAPKSSAKT